MNGWMNEWTNEWLEDDQLIHLSIHSFIHLSASRNSAYITFLLAGFDVWDINMHDLLTQKITLGINEISAIECKWVIDYECFYDTAISIIIIIVIIIFIYYNHHCPHHHLCHINSHILSPITTQQRLYHISNHHDHSIL